MEAQMFLRIYTLYFQQRPRVLEQLYLAFDWKFEDIAIMDDIFPRLSRMAPTATPVQLKAPYENHSFHIFNLWVRS